MLVNGWNNPGPAVQGYIGTISGGTFTGGSINYQNDDNGKIDKIRGDAVITNETQTAIQKHQYHREIQAAPSPVAAGLSTTPAGRRDRGMHRHYYHQGWRCPSWRNQQYNKGQQQQSPSSAKTTTEGGKISRPLTDDGLTLPSGDISRRSSISGGYFTADPTSYLVSGKDSVASNQDGYQYMVGTLALSQQTLALTQGRRGCPVCQCRALGRCACFRCVLVQRQ